MNINYMQNNSNKIWTKTIIISIVTCCIILLIFSQTTLFQSTIRTSINYVETSSQISSVYYIENDIHVVLVCATNQFNEMAISTIKSIMFYHHKSYNITFHIFTDNDGEKTISKYFNSITNNVCTIFRIYQIDKLLEIAKEYLDENHITNTHYSGIYALSKAFIHDILPQNVTHILLVDTDIIFMNDIYSIWKQFNLFKKNKTALGMVPWNPPVPVDYKYIGKLPDPFLTGVILLDLNVCRSIGLTQLLNQAIDIVFNQFGLRSIGTADQTILSLFATYFPEHIVSLPCFVNGHTYHYLKDGQQWKDGCKNEYIHNIHVVPSSNLLNSNHYFGHLYIFFKDMPIEWISHCSKEV